MSDENENGGFPAFFLNLGGPTADQLEQMRMSAEDQRHKVRTFIDSLDEDQIRTLIMILESAKEDNGSGNFFIGMLIAFLDQKFQACSGCGKNHDKMLAEMSGQAVATEPESAPWPPGANLREGYPLEEWESLAETYGLEFNDDGVLSCVNCHVEYQSLKDRMLRAPGIPGCSTCVQKEKWG